jgi:hypothetical protein
MVLKEAEMDGESQFKAVMEYVEDRKQNRAAVR